MCVCVCGCGCVYVCVFISIDVFYLRLCGHKRIFLCFLFFLSENANTFPIYF